MNSLKVIITGATGMVGEGILQECLQNPTVDEILIVNRKEYSIQHPKLNQKLVDDLNQINEFDNELLKYNACFFCAGVSSIGMNEDEYTKLTYDLTLNFAKILAEINPEITFCYVSGKGTDSSESGNVMWARVKGKTENHLLKLPFKSVYNFRPGFMKPSPGAKNVKGIFKLINFIYPILRFFSKTYFLTLEEVGKSMTIVAINGYNKHVLEVQDISFLSNKY